MGREQRRCMRNERRAAKRAAEKERKRLQAPRRIRKGASACLVFGFLALLGGLASSAGTPTFQGDAYTEIVEQLAAVSGAVAWLAAVLLFTVSALLKALADILDELRLQTVGRTASI